MNNGRRRVLAALGGLCLAPCHAIAQQGARTYRVAYVITTAALKPGRLFATLRSLLAGKGFVDGENLDLRFFALRPEEEVPQSPERVLREVVAWQPDAVMSGGVMCAKRLQQASSSIPIVFFGIQDPVSQGLVQSLARPGRNSTGTGVHYDELAIKRLELVREMLPAARRVVVLTDRSLGGVPPVGQEGLMQASRRLGLSLVELDVGALPDGLCGAGKQAADLGANAALTWGSFEPPASFRGLKDWYGACMSRFQRDARAPIVDDSPDSTRGGVAAALGDDVDDGFRRAAEMVGEILKGSMPSTTPVDMQMRVRMSVNEEALRELGVELPASVRVRADPIVH